MGKENYHSSPQDIAKRFFRNINVFRIAMFVILFVSFIFYAYLVFATEKDSTGFFFAFLLLCALVVIARTLHALIEIMKLNLIINRNCDPVKYAEVFLILREHRWFQKRMGSATLNIAQGYYFSGRFEDAYYTLLELKSTPKQPILALQYCMLIANCGMELGRPELVFQADTEVNRILATQKPKSGNAKNAKLILNNINSFMAVQDKKYNDAIELTKKNQMTAQVPIQKVSVAFRLANIYFQMGDYQNAKSCFEFVVQNGNRLFYADRAQEMLPLCMKYMAAEAGQNGG